jgi:hypothetical protein
VRRLLIAADGGPITTRDMIELIYPGRTSWPRWCWRDIRASAHRWAVPVLQPRSRPLHWRLKKPVT